MSKYTVIAYIDVAVTAWRLFVQQRCKSSNCLKKRQEINVAKLVIHILAKAPNAYAFVPLAVKETYSFQKVFLNGGFLLLNITQSCLSVAEVQPC